MDFPPRFEPLREANEFRNQLAASKRLGFFFGAGSSMSLGIPGLEALTAEVQAGLAGDNKSACEKIQQALGGKANIEEILNQLRLIRQITKEEKGKSYDGVDGPASKQLDIAICNTIYEIISKKEAALDLSITEKFAMWYNWLSRDYSKEIFTTNYDLVLERSLENLTVSYFDGFVGANQPFFLPESLEPENRLEYPPLSWIRLWKIHGSLNWYWMAGKGSTHRIIRLGVGAKEALKATELVIYPSREKYDSSRKQPFVAYFDRLKNYLLEREGLFIVSGYSFQDQHINAVLFNGLKQNNRLHIMALMYLDSDLERIADQGQSYPNLTLFGPKKAVIGGFGGAWIPPSPPSSKTEAFWDSTKKDCRVGDFKALVEFLLESSGKREKIEREVVASHAS